MTDEEAEGNPAHPFKPDDIRTEDYPSFNADMVTLDHAMAKLPASIEEGDEHG